MDFLTILSDILVEEVKNKKLFTNLYQNWKTQDEDLTPEQAEFYYLNFMGGNDDEGNRIDGIKDRLSTKRIQVQNFLKRFDGEYNRTKFEPEKLKDINAYSLRQLIFLLKQFGKKLPKSFESKKNYFFEDSSVPQSEYIAKGKEYWFGEEMKVYDDGKGFRIYKPKTVRDSVAFGYWQGGIKGQRGLSSLTPGGHKWCVTTHNRDAGGQDSMTNLWHRYRGEHQRTFFFIIDETRQMDDEYHTSALQKLGDPNEGEYRITNQPNTNQDMLVRIDNPQDESKSLKHIYPQFREVDWLEEQKHEEFDSESELDIKVDELTRLMMQIYERPGEYDFVIQDPEVKRAYINRGNELSELRSYESLSDDDIKLYFEVRTNQNNPLDAVKTYEILSYLVKKRSGNLRGYLSKWYQRLGSSVAEAYRKILKNTFDDSFKSNRSDNIYVLQDTNSKKYGIIDYSNGEWVKHNNIKYEPQYDWINSDMGSFNFNIDVDNSDDQPTQQQGEKIYVVEVFSKNNSIDDQNNFYLVADVANTTDTTGKPIVSIFSHQTWMKEAEPYFISSDDPEGRWDPTTSSDISDKDPEAVN